MIIDEYNQNAIEMILETADPTGTGSFWIGLTDMFHEANFEWTTREPLTYTNWYEPNPDNWERIEHFTLIWPTSLGRKWDDGSNDGNCMALCQLTSKKK